MSCTMLSLSKLCAKVGAFCEQHLSKPGEREESRQLNTRRSFGRPRPTSEDSFSLLDLAADVARKHIDLYSTMELDSLPVDLAQHLVVKLVYAGKLTEGLLAKFASHRLSSLQLSGSVNVSNAWLARTPAFALHHLSLANCAQVTGEGLRFIQQQTNLRELDLTGCTGLDNAALAHLSGLRQMQKLSMGGCDGLTEAGLVHLAMLTALTSLDLEQWRNLNTLQSLHGMKNLRYLNLGWCCNIGDGTVLRYMRVMKKLQDLRLSSCRITDVGLEVLAVLTQLERLDLTGCQAVNNACIPKVAALPRLRHLSLERCKQLSSAGLAQLASATSLQHLNVAYTGASNTAVLQWKSLVNLRTLILDSCIAVQDEAMALLKHLPLLEDLDLSDTMVTNAGLVHLEPLKKIRSVSLSYTGGADSVSDVGTARLSRLVSLHSLKLDMRSISDGGVRNLSGLSNLRHLDLFGAKITDAGCVWLRKLTALESLEICGGAVTDRGVAHMGPLLKLRHLSLAQNARITDSSLLVLSSLTALSFLNLSQSKLTGNGIQHLQNLQKLEALIINNTRVRRPAADRLQAAMPNLHLVEC